MNEYYLSDVYISNESLSGLGVFANRDFEKREMIEFSPFLRDKKRNWFQTLAKEYVFKINDIDSAFGLGYTGLYNHQDDSNARFKVISKKQGWIDGILIFATRPIKKGEEIFISYGTRYWESRKDKEKKISPSSCFPSPSSSFPSPSSSFPSPSSPSSSPSPSP